MDSPVKKRIKYTEDEVGAVGTPFSITRRFSETRRGNVHDYFIERTSMCIDVIGIICEYTDEEKIEDHLTLAIHHCGIENSLILSGGRLMVALSCDRELVLIRIEDSARIGSSLLPWVRYFWQPDWIQYDKTHLVIFRNDEYCVWNMAKFLVFGPFKVKIDENTSATVMNMTNVPLHGRRIFALGPASTYYLLEIELQEDTVKFHVVWKTVDKDVVPISYVLGDRFMFDKDMKRAQDREGPLYASIRENLRWVSMMPEIDGNHHFIPGEDYVLRSVEPHQLECLDAKETECFWRIDLFFGALEVLRLNDSQLLCWDTFNFDHLFLLSINTGDLIPVDTEPRFQVVSCHDSTVLGKVNDEFKILRFW